ncbi:MAG: chondroitinase-B domain-containing protein [Fuerstiella sp.]
MTPTLRKHLFFGILATLLSAISTSAAEISVGDPDALAAAIQEVAAGDTIILQDGVWTDVRLIVRTNGTAEKPVTIRAQTRGKVILTGDSRIALAGEHIVVDGLWFQNPTGTESIVLRTGVRELANDCRFSQPL